MSGRRNQAYFGPEFFAFLRRLKRNNNREWFDKNKPRYIEQVRDPLLAFIADFAPRLEQISENFVADPRPSGGSMFRIYRDVRFSKDKRPYKTAAGVQFRHSRGKDVHAPGFYLHLEPGAVFVGSGIWRPDTAALAKIRNAIVDEPRVWKRILGSRAFKTGLRMGGDSLKRPPRGFDPDDPLIEDLKRKDFYTVLEFDEKAAARPDFIERFAKSCAAGAPLVKFLAEALELKF